MKCAIDCRKAAVRRKRALEKLENERSYYRSEIEKSSTSSDSEFDISDSTEYQSLPERISNHSHKSKSSREYIKHVKTPPRTSKKLLDKSFMCLSGRDNSHHSAYRSKKNYNHYEHSPKSHREKLSFSNDEEMSSRSETKDTNHQEKYHGEYKQRKCHNEDCSPSKSNSSFIKRHTSDSDYTQSDCDIENGMTESESLLCPELCEHDILRIPNPKTTCESSCPKQLWLNKKRERCQAKVDKYILNKGLNYFDDLCHCSLKCFMTQICMDPFVKKTAASAAFFFLGIKLCFELDSWYIPF